MSLKRHLKEAYKQALRKMFELGQFLGFDVLPRHFYSEIPDILFAQPVRVQRTVDISSFKTDDHARAVMRQSLNLSEMEIVLLSFKGPDLLLRAVKQLSPDVREKVNVVFWVGVS